MSALEGKPLKWALAGLMVALLVGVGTTQRALNRQRTDMGLRDFTELKGAPPVLAFTTVALGGVRGLIANVLWIRSIELQDEGKYFEKVQLTDWITKLQPHFVQVWVMQAWDMAYNISVKFTEPADRWRWVQRGFELLRDEGLKYNPRETAIYHMLAWIFQHKMGHNLDDANMYYKRMWLREMTGVMGPPGTSFEEWLNPQTEEAKQRITLLREKYKMDPAIMKEVDDRYGPLEWRLPDAHAIYWASLGLQRAKPQEIITLRRIVYQSLMQAFSRGRLVSVRADGTTLLDPNLDLVPRVHDTFLQMMEEDEPTRQQLQTPHKNFLKNAVEFLYTHNRLAEAARWYKELGTRFPDAPLFDDEPNSRARNVSLDEFAVRRVAQITGETDPNKTTAVIGGLFVQSFVQLSHDEDDQALIYDRLARRVWDRYMQDIGPSQVARIPLAEIAEIRQRALDGLLKHDGMLNPLLRGYLITKLGLPTPTNAPPTVGTAANVPSSPLTPPPPPAPKP